MEYQKQINKNNIQDLYTGWTHYLTHDNGNLPFCVWINSLQSNQPTVHVYKQGYITIGSDEDSNDEPDEESDPCSPSTYTEFVCEFEPVNVFVGISQLNPMTQYSGGHGTSFEGNSILLHLGTNKYVFIGSNIFSFRTTHEIVEYMSPVGNNDVPYPYAIDSQGDYYLMIENAIIRVDDPTKKDDPYVYYYNALDKIQEYLGAEHVEINGEIYSFNSHPEPSKDYDGLAKRIGSPIYIKFKDQEKRVISKQEYVGILTQYNNSIGLSSLQDYCEIVKRDW